MMGQLVKETTQPEAACVERSRYPNVIVWSGGYDSTALVLRALSGHHHVSTVSFSIAQNETQQEAERKARQRIVEAFPGRIETKELEIQGGSVSVGCCDLAQPLLWLTRCSTLDGPDFELAYVRGDDFWHRRSEALAVVASVNTFRTHQPMRVHFPFEWETKDDILRFYTESPKTMHVLSMVSCSERHPGWYHEEDGWECDKNSEIRGLWEKALNQWGKMRAQVLDKVGGVC